MEFQCIFCKKTNPTQNFVCELKWSQCIWKICFVSSFFFAKLSLHLWFLVLLWLAHVCKWHTVNFHVGVVTPVTVIAVTIWVRFFVFFLLAFWIQFGAICLHFSPLLFFAFPHAKCRGNQLLFVPIHICLCCVPCSTSFSFAVDFLSHLCCFGSFHAVHPTHVVCCPKPLIQTLRLLSKTINANASSDVVKQLLIVSTFFAQKFVTKAMVCNHQFQIVFLIEWSCTLNLPRHFDLIADWMAWWQSLTSRGTGSSAILGLGWWLRTGNQKWGHEFDLGLRNLNPRIAAMDSDSPDSIRDSDSPDSIPIPGWRQQGEMAIWDPDSNPRLEPEECLHREGGMSREISRGHHPLSWGDGFCLAMPWIIDQFRHCLLVFAPRALIIHSQVKVSSSVTHSFLVFFQWKCTAKEFFNTTKIHSFGEWHKCQQIESEFVWDHCRNVCVTTQWQTIFALFFCDSSWKGHICLWEEMFFWTEKLKCSIVPSPHLSRSRPARISCQLFDAARVTWQSQRLNKKKIMKAQPVLNTRTKRFCNLCGAQQKRHPPNDSAWRVSAHRRLFAMHQHATWSHRADFLCSEPHNLHNDFCTKNSFASWPLVAWFDPLRTGPAHPSNPLGTFLVHMTKRPAVAGCSDSKARSDNLDHCCLAHRLFVCYKFFEAISSAAGLQTTTFLAQVSTQLPDSNVSPCV